jgi:FkbM family methyltransferase
MNFVVKILSTLHWVTNHPLHEQHKAKAALTFSVVQVAARMIPGDVCIPFPNGSSLLISPRMKGAAHFIFPGLCEFDTMSFVLHFLRKEELFVDAGAYVGAYTVLAGAAGGRVMAFEPSPATFSYLEKNVRLNKLGDSARLFNLALGAEDGMLRFTEGLGTENYVCLDSAVRDTIKVGVTTLDKMLADQKPVLLKMDVEGFETKVITGAGQTLSCPTLQAIIIERYGNAERYGDNEAKLHERIRSNSFEPCTYSPRNRTLCRLAPDDTGNIIYVRNFDTAQQRLRQAPPYQFGALSV